MFGGLAGEFGRLDEWGIGGIESGHLEDLSWIRCVETGSSESGLDLDC